MSDGDFKDLTRRTDSDKILRDKAFNIDKIPRHVGYQRRLVITNASQKILHQSDCKPNKIWVDKAGEFYNRSMKSFLQNNNIETYSTHNEESVVAERCIRTL